MSRHIYKTIHNGSPTTILMGWDQASQNYFLIIFKPYLEKDRPFYSSLSANNGQPFKMITPLLEILKTSNILLPQEMIDELYLLTPFSFIFTRTFRFGDKNGENIFEKAQFMHYK